MGLVCCLCIDSLVVILLVVKCSFCWVCIVSEGDGGVVVGIGVVGGRFVLVLGSFLSFGLVCVLLSCLYILSGGCGGCVGKVMLVLVGVFCNIVVLCLCLWCICFWLLLVLVVCCLVVGMVWVFICCFWVCICICSIFCIFCGLEIF